MITEDQINNPEGSGQKKQEPDYYILPDGRYVFTASYHLKRGYCCGNGCRHCPYQYINVPEPRRTELLEKRKQSGCL